MHTAVGEQTKVLLVTAHRSGSTFLGELFNRNEDAFYVFEPLISGNTLAKMLEELMMRA